MRYDFLMLTPHTMPMLLMPLFTLALITPRHYVILPAALLLRHADYYIDLRVRDGMRRSLDAII